MQRRSRQPPRGQLVAGRAKSGQHQIREAVIVIGVWESGKTILRVGLFAVWQRMVNFN